MRTQRAFGRRSRERGKEPSAAERGGSAVLDLLLLALVALGAAPLGAGVSWRTDFETAQAEAQAAGRPLVLDFWAIWCGPCQKMDREVWSRDDVTQGAAEFAMVRVDVDRAAAIAARYNVQAYPTVVVTDSWGNGIARRTGTVDAREILDLLARVPRDFRPIDSWNAALAENPKHGEALLAVGRFYSERKLADVGVAYFEKALKSDRAKHERTFEARTHVAIGWNQLTLREFKPAEKAFERSLTAGAAVEDREAALFGLVVAAVGRDDHQKAERRLEELRAAFPASVATDKASRLVAEKRRARPASG